MGEDRPTWLLLQWASAIDVFWKDITAGLRKSRFLDCIYKNFLAQVIKESTRKVALLDPVLTNKEELVSNVKVGGRLGYSDHEMMEFRFLIEGNRAESNTTVLDLRKEDLNILRDLLERIP